jgi:hypothetical protein
MTLLLTFFILAFLATAAALIGIVTQDHRVEIFCLCLAATLIAFALSLVFTALMNTVT